MKIRLLHFLTIALLAIGLCACEKPSDTRPTPKIDPAASQPAPAPATAPSSK